MVVDCFEVEVEVEVEFEFEFKVELEGNDVELLVNNQVGGDVVVLVRGLELFDMALEKTDVKK